MQDTTDRPRPRPLTFIVVLTGEGMSEEPALESCSARLGMARSDWEGCLRTILENESGGREAMIRPPACTVWYTSDSNRVVSKRLSIHIKINKIINKNNIFNFGNAPKSA